MESDAAVDDEALDAETNADTVDMSEPDSKRVCIAMADVGINSAFTVLRKSVVKMPWETGPLSPLFTGVFSFQQKTDLPGLPHVGVGDVSTNIERKEVSPAKDPKPIVSLTSFVKKRIAASKFTISDDDLRVRALGHFRKLICSDLKGTAVGISLIDKAGKLCDEDDLATTVSDTLAHKSTGTLLKRASSMVRFFAWMVQYRDTSCFRPSEKDLYDYMQYLRHSGAGATAASHFEQAFRMCHEVLRMVHVDIKQVMSSRVTGAAHWLILCFFQRGSWFKLLPFQWKLSRSLRTFACIPRACTRGSLQARSFSVFSLVLGGSMQCISMTYGRMFLRAWS